MRKERGSALITVILVVLVLSMVGVAALVYMSVEDKISGNDRLQKEALYAAECGMRMGERALSRQLNNGQTIGMLLLNSPNGVATIGVTPAVPVFPASQTQAAYTIDRLGTYLRDPDTTQVMANVPVPYLTPAGGVDNSQAFCSVYVRNNVEDVTGTPTQDQDGKLTLISVGYIPDHSGGARAVKIVGEGFSPLGKRRPGPQADLNAGATNAWD